ncbi:MarR family transcriptional regulator [Scrofimicrobium sp. R131]|uniref:MarR family transcriptional regulator n=1 Tax=Scrofimicrobium appendicitidis TaxID=3079930 RepID=A0AAU7VB02_9ACTO
MNQPREDESARIVRAWTHERPDLDASPMLVFSRLSRLSRHFDLLRRRAFATHELEPWEFDVLATLRRAGKPYSLTPGQLLAELLVSSGTMTNRIDRLEGRGLVVRGPAPSDRRAILVSLTEDGRTRVDSALATLLNSERELLEPLSTEERDRLAELLMPLLTVFEA